MTEREHHDSQVSSGGGAHDVTGPEAAAHVAETHTSDAHHTGDAEPVDEHDEAPLGPIDWAAWRAAALGIAISALMVVLLYIAIR